MSSNTTVDGIDYGPLFQLIGTWEGDKGLDIAPDPDGQEENPYYEKLMFEPIGDVTNAESQTLAVLRYHQVVTRKSDNKVFHNETGYWSWDASNSTVMHSLTIPRGVCLLAGGTIQSSDTSEINVSAAIDDPDWGITQSPFMQNNARTTRFDQILQIRDNTLNYQETTILEIYSKTFEHKDSNTLTRR